MAFKYFNKPVIYFLQGNVTRRIKIGSTSWPIEERIRKLQTGSPDILEFIGGYCGHEFIEVDLHRRFSEYRLHGEWFEPSQPILSFIGQNCLNSTDALYQAYSLLIENKMTYQEILSIGTKELEKIREAEIIEILESSCPDI